VSGVDRAVAGLLLEASLANELDPVERFVEILGDDMRREARETLRLKSELVENVRRMLSATTPAEAVGYAARVRAEALNVGFRWSVLVAAAARYAEHQTSRTGSR